MSLWRIAWRSVQQRALASCLTTLSMALGVALVVAVLSIHGVIFQSFRNNSSLGYNMIVGAKGGKLQLTLNTVYYLSQPVENLPYTYYLEFLDAAARAEALARAGAPPEDPPRDGRYGPFVALAIPVCLGDYFGPFRVVGTTPDFFDKLTLGRKSNQKFAFAQGRNFRFHTPENGYFEAVIGAAAARERGVRLGDRIAFTHGDPEGEGHGRKFTVVGVLAPSGTPNDRAVFVNMEGFYLMEGHAKPVGGSEGGADHHDHHPEAGGALETVGGAGDPGRRPAPADARHETGLAAGGGRAEIPQPLPIAQREVTAILVRTANEMVTMGLENRINESLQAQAVLPIREITNLFEILVKPIQRMLLLLTGMICVVSGVGILVSIYNSMSERRREIAVMRALGARRAVVMIVILLESAILCLGGGALGWLSAHGLNRLASPLIEQRTGVRIGFWDLAPGAPVLEWLGLRGGPVISTEALLVPALVLLAILAGVLPALSAYRTDVARSLGD